MTEPRLVYGLYDREWGIGYANVLWYTTTFMRNGRPRRHLGAELDTYHGLRPPLEAAHPLPEVRVRRTEYQFDAGEGVEALRLIAEAFDAGSATTPPAELQALCDAGLPHLDVVWLGPAGGNPLITITVPTGGHHERAIQLMLIEHWDPYPPNAPGAPYAPTLANREAVIAYLSEEICHVQNLD